MNKTLGIIGGGQLAMFMAISAKKYNINTIILEPKKDCSAKSFSTKHINLQYDSLEGLEELFKRSDVITYENENINIENLNIISQKYPNKLIQGIMPLKISQDRFIEKSFLRENKITTSKFGKIDDLRCFENLLKNTDIFPIIIKSRRFGYDGKNQVIIKSKNDIKSIELSRKLITNTSCIWEEFLDFDFECSIIGVYDDHKLKHHLPITKNTHKNGILVRSEIISNDKLEHEAKNIFNKISKSLKWRGILTIELFLLKNGCLVVNELAPRVHNSGHHSLDNCTENQFDILIKNLFMLPIKINIINNRIMFNILGQNYKYFLNIKETSKLSKYDYGKKEPEINRKMAHINVDNDLKLLLKIQKELNNE